MVGVNREGCVGTSKGKAGNLRRKKVRVSVLDMEKPQQLTASPLPGEVSLRPLGYSPQHQQDQLTLVSSRQ